MRIVIPALREPTLLETIRSLAENQTGRFSSIEVFVVLNSSELHDEHVREFHRRQANELRALELPFDVRPMLLENIPRKKAGVGYARKTGMDAALQHFNREQNPNGIIVCLDGDCNVADNYIEKLLCWQETIDGKQACYLSFEHPLNDTDSQAIIAYETHLRLMKIWLEWVGHPQAFHAVGSCLAVRCWAYAAQGGMNTRQAGEDFYFIHKFSKIGELEELRDSTVYPSARVSDRVPFGTGASMQKVSRGELQSTYNPASYYILKEVCEAIPSFYNSDERIDVFQGFKKEEIQLKIDEAKKHTSTKAQFISRFFQFFDAFQVIKFLHYIRDKKHPDVSVSQSCTELFDKVAIALPQTAKEQLVALRKYERESNHLAR